MGSYEHGDKLGRYEIMRLLGAGGMGEVYLAQDPHLGREVAIKVLHARYTNDQHLRDRFVHEARAAAELKHPHIITIHDVQRDDVPYIVMEHIPDGSLRDRLERLAKENRVLPIPETFELITQVTDALGWAHENGQVHGDIKPGNVLLERQRRGTGYLAKLSDFGLARPTGASSSMGTPAYMAPEQFQDQEADARTDLYALGIMLYEMLLGTRPFSPARTGKEWADLHAHEAPTPPSELDPAFPGALERLVLKAIAKDPNERFQIAQEFKHGLQTVDIDDVKTQIDASAQQRAGDLDTQPYSGDVPEPPSIPPSQSPQDHILVVDASGATGDPIELPGNQKRFLIGRDKNADIGLKDRAVSREHAYLTREADASFTITDLDTQNGTRLDSTQLLSNAPEPWEPHQTIAIGPYRLILRPGVEEQVTRETSQSEQRSAAVSVSLESTSLTVAAGGEVETTVSITNHGGLVEHFRGQVSGIAADWASFKPEVLQLMPGDSGTIDLILHPPRVPASRAATHPFTVDVVRSKDDKVLGNTGGEVTIEPFYQSEYGLGHERINQGGATELTIRNRGNTTESYTIRAEGDVADVTVKPAEMSLEVPAGASETVSLAVNLDEAYDLQSEERFQFEIKVSGAQSNDQTFYGTLVCRPASYSFEGPGNRHTELRVPHSRQVRTVIDDVKREMDARVWFPRLIHNGQPLAPDTTLAEAGVQDGDKLQLRSAIDWRWVVGGLAAVAAVALLVLLAFLLIRGLAGEDDSDDDGDGIIAENDNCPDVYNPSQEDNDGNDIGWACDSGEPHQIAYLACPAGSDLFENECELAVIGLDGRNRRVLAENVGGLRPYWSPLGEEVAIVLCRDSECDTRGIFVINAVTGERRLLGEGRPGLSWSPDGTQIAYSTGSGENAEIHVMDSTDGTILRRLTDNDQPDEVPLWSPDGQFITFRQRPHIMRMAPDGSGKFTLVPDVAVSLDDTFSAWSPHGDTLAYSDSEGNLNIIAADGRRQVRLTTREVARWPHWSPDGERITFSSSVDEPDIDVHLVSVTDATVTPVTTNGHSAFGDWSPDGDRIALVDFVPDDLIGEVWVMSPDGSNGEQVTSDGGMTFFPYWRPR